MKQSFIFVILLGLSFTSLAAPVPSARGTANAIVFRRSRLNTTTTATSLTAVSPPNHAAPVNITVAPPTGGVHGNASQHEVANSSKGLPFHAELEAVAYNGAPLINNVLRWGIKSANALGGVFH